MAKMFKKINDYVVYFSDDASFSISEWKEHPSGTRKYYCRAGAFHYQDIIQEELPPGVVGDFSDEDTIPQPSKFTSIKEVAEWMEKNRIKNDQPCD